MDRLIPDLMPTSFPTTKHVSSLFPKLDRSESTLTCTR